MARRTAEIPRDSAREIFVSCPEGILFKGIPERKCPIRTKQSEVIRTLETILLVDDEDYIRELVSAILAIEGYHVLEAESGPRALEVAEAYPGPIHLLLT